MKYLLSLSASLCFISLHSMDDTGAAQAATSATRLQAPEKHTQQLLNAIHDKINHLKYVTKHSISHDEEKCICEEPICCSFLNRQIDNALNNGANPNLLAPIKGSKIGYSHEKTSLYLACEGLAKFETKTIKKLLEYGGDPTQKYQLPLLSLLVIVTHPENEAIIQENIFNLRQYGADPKTQVSSQGESPFQLAQNRGLQRLFEKTRSSAASSANS